MWRGIFALLFRSLRTDSRSIRFHLLWFFLLIVIYIALGMALSTSVFFGAPGQIFFRYVAFLNAAFITMLGIGFFSSAITEEKEEDTLGLMTMAGISLLGILLGKSTSRLIQVLVLLAIQYPFTLLAITMGGLLQDQIVRAYLCLFAYTILLANVGLLMSVLCRRNRDASGLTTLWLIFYGAAPAFAGVGFWYLTQVRNWGPTSLVRRVILESLKWLMESNIVTALYHATETGNTLNELLPQIISNTVGGVICFFMAWGLFHFVAKDPAPEATSRGWVARHKEKKTSLFGPGRVWDRSLVWKDFHFIAGGTFGVVIRSLLYLSLYGLCILCNSSWLWEKFGSGYVTQFRWDDVTWGFLFFAHPLLAIEAAILASAVFQEEIRRQTFSSLLMLPRSVPDIVYSKLTGCGIALLPGIVANVIGIFWMPDGIRIMTEVIDSTFFLYWLMNLVFMIHLTAVLSLYLRWGALAMSIGLTVGSMFVTATVWTTSIIMGVSSGNSASFYGLSSVILMALCIGCHSIVIKNTTKLGER